MTRQSTKRRAFAPVAVGVAVFTVLAAGPVPAFADPEVNEKDVDGELQEAIEEYLDAKETLETTDDRQDKIKSEIADSKKQVKRLGIQAGDFAAAAYTSGGDLRASTIVLTAGSPRTAIQTLALVSYLGEQTGAKIDELTEAREDLEAEKKSLSDEKDKAEKALGKLESARDKAARAVASGGGNSAQGPSASDAPAAEPAPAGLSGGCTEDDPTPADGCLTPRTLHALEQAQIAGFQRYVSCYRGGGNGEHPQGRACDFSAEPGGFGGDATGAAKAYGDNLAAWLVDNADALGVMYVIWYRQFWDPSQGWTTYSGGGGPSGAHTNHVHLSMV
ncbi:coiled-coil domain-containing protein [Stackebrandtia nassauensis]|uniref:ARB-07466-like C-terminal domain-containing protein n=1 Tax=Stackebrandtia nassauensis (strain DSM 44728 / CIP 108903 / NRRL B-16338 / NBRC 102104 / LLR-40K-21) TaxID=446470 RepID=D3PZY3_STANL|nr:hypothetical protein [Stackebrandtia nassauensis]ADD43670.1 hypothetical protein Snas_4018 [Stackebrandtia nassauensis DSM 44728]